MAGDSDKAELIAQLAAARERLARTGRALQDAGELLRQKLDVPARAKESFEKHRPAWLGGATLIGLLLSKLPARKKTVFVERSTGQALGMAGKLGAVWSAAKFAAGIAKPFLGEIAGQRLGELARRFTNTAKENEPPPSGEKRG